MAVFAFGLLGFALTVGAWEGALLIGGLLVFTVGELISRATGRDVSHWTNLGFLSQAQGAALLIVGLSAFAAWDFAHGETTGGFVLLFFLLAALIWFVIAINREGWSKKES